MSHTELRILGFEGKAGTGKDTLAHRIALLSGAEVVPFADAVRAYAMQHHAELGYPDTPSWEKPYSPAIRKLLCDAGDRMRREDPLAVVKAWKCTRNKVIIPDVRYPAERAFVRKHGKTLYLWRPNYEVVDHDSEALQPDGNLVVLPELGTEAYDELVHQISLWFQQ